MSEKVYDRHAVAGCVCPAGAEKTCRGPTCPRKPVPQFRASARGCFVPDLTTMSQAEAEARGFA